MSSSQLHTVDEEAEENMEVVDSNVITPSMLQSLFSDNIEEQLSVTTELRKILQADDPPIDEIIQNGIVPRLVEFLEEDNNSELQFNAEWALTNIAAGTSLQTRSLVKASAVPALVRLLSSEHERVQEQAAWALGNIAGDCIDFRDLVLSHGAMTPLLQLMNNLEGKMTEIAIWTLHNLCKGEDLPNFVDVSACLPVLLKLLFAENAEIVSNACWTLSYLCPGSNESIETVINSGVCPKLVQLLTHTTDEVVLSALRAVGNITYGDNAQTQVILNCDVLHSIHLLLTHATRETKRKACFVLANITGGNEQQVQAVIDAEIFPLLVQIMQKEDDEDLKLRSEAVYAIRNALTCGSVEQIRYIAQQGFILPLCNLLTVTDRTTLVELCLDCLSAILQLGDQDSKTIGGLNPYAVMIEACCGLDKIRFLYARENMFIVTQCSYIMQRFFDMEDEDEDEDEDEEI